MCSSNDCGDDGVNRRDFLVGAAATFASLTILPTGETNAQTKQPETRVLDDPRVEHGKVFFKHNGVDTIDGYLARPKAEGVYPAVLVIAGNKISEEYIPNTCAALALAGYVGLAPNVFHPLPDDVRFGDNEAYNKYLANHTELDRLDDIQAGISYLRTQSFVSSNGMGVVGFCRGGREAMLCGARCREIDAVVPFHPAPMKPSELIRLKKVPVQLHHGTADQSVSVTETKKTEKALKAQGTPVEAFYYDGCDHGFLAYTRSFYKPDAAKLAWSRTLKFLDKNLK